VFDTEGGAEECDLGADNGPGQPCTAECKLNVCGDGDKSFGEPCDDGNTMGGDGCSATCQLEECGNDVVDEGEACDDGANGNQDDGCTDDCAEPACGDTFTQMSLMEECDEGADNNNTGTCTLTCKLPKCGDTFTQMSLMEECDDGNMVNDDACSNTCKTAKCGDAIKQMAEECDDGNMVNDDACSNMCKTAKCGDGIKQANEECDDGNMVDNDTCNNMCKKPLCPGGGALHLNRCWYASTQCESTAAKCASVGLTGVDGYQNGLTWDMATMSAVAGQLGLVAGGDAGCCVEFGWIQNNTIFTHNFGPNFYNWSGCFNNFPTLKACNPQ
jgi:cysteine-rich repeat protein